MQETMKDLKFQQGEMSQSEKQLMCYIYKESKQLPYPIHEEIGADGIAYKMYDIPEGKRQEELAREWPFVAPYDCPQMDDTRFCIHEGKEFRVGDYLMLRYAGRNLPVSLYFLHSGGMLIDWTNEAPEEGNVKDIKICKEEQE